MTPRLLTRTHYQVDEPAFLRLLVVRCTSPTQSNYKERIADRLVKEIRAMDEPMNVAAARYAVDLGRATGLLNANHVWTDRAHLLNLIGRSGDEASGLNLTPHEQVFFFHLLLHSDGAAMVYFLRELAARAVLPGRENWNTIANSLFLWTFRSYYALTSDLRARIRLRQMIQQRQSKPFSGAHSGDHQCFVHLQSFYRLGLIGKANGEDSRTYVPKASLGVDRVNSIFHQLRDVQSLEQAIKEGRWLAFSAQLFSNAKTEAPPDELRLLGDFLTAYRRAMATGIPLCPLSALIESVQIEQIIRSEAPQPYTSLIDEIKKLQRRYPRQVHFHVDRFGRPAYLKINGEIAKVG